MIVMPWISTSILFNLVNLKRNVCVCVCIECGPQIHDQGFNPLQETDNMSVMHKKVTHPLPLTQKWLDC